VAAAVLLHGSAEEQGVSLIKIYFGFSISAAHQVIIRPPEHDDTLVKRRCRRD